MKTSRNPVDVQRKMEGIKNVLKTRNSLAGAALLLFKIKPRNRAKVIAIRIADSILIARSPGTPTSDINFAGKYAIQRKIVGAETQPLPD